MGTTTILAGLALILALVSAVAIVPLWIPIALLAAAMLIKDGAIRL